VSLTEIEEAVGRLPPWRTAEACCLRRKAGQAFWGWAIRGGLFARRQARFGLGEDRCRDWGGKLPALAV